MARFSHGYGETRVFADRTEAGRLLADALLKYKGEEIVVLAIPRGGVAVAVEVSRALDAPLDLVIPRKLGSPGNPELAVGAVAATGDVVVNEQVREELGVSDAYIQEETNRQLREIERRRRLYLGEKPPVSLVGRVAIIVDDGLATGFTAIAAARSIKQEGAAKVVLAIPVAPPDTYRRLEPEVDEIVCLEIPEVFFAVGQFYREFQQVSDDEVIRTMERENT